MCRLLTIIAGRFLIAANEVLAQRPGLVVFLPWSPVHGTTVIDGQMLWLDSLETHGDTIILRQVVANLCNHELRAQFRVSHDTLRLELRDQLVPQSPNLRINGCRSFRTYEARIAPIAQQALSPACLPERSQTWGIDGSSIQTRPYRS